MHVHTGGGPDERVDEGAAQTAPYAPEGFVARGGRAGVVHRAAVRGRRRSPLIEALLREVRRFP